MAERRAQPGLPGAPMSGIPFLLATLAIVAYAVTLLVRDLATYWTHRHRPPAKRPVPDPRGAPVSTWNYRLVRETIEVPGMPGATEERVSCIEAYYEEGEDPEGRPSSWCAAGPPGGETVEEWLDDIERMRAAYNREVIEVADLPGYRVEEPING